MLTVGSLFAGIGGFDLGFERAGFQIAWQVEIDPWARAVLAKHWPHVPRFADIHDIQPGDLTPVDALCGGFPCQPFSQASRGRRRGAEDARFLWPAMFGVIARLRPTWVVAENVPHIDGPVLKQVASDLEGGGYQVQVLEVPACAVGLDHWRARYWICGHTDRDRQSGGAVDAEAPRVPRPGDDAIGVGAPHGLPRGLDRRRMQGLGNAIVPALARWLAEGVLTHHQNQVH